MFIWGRGRSWKQHQHFWWGHRAKLSPEVGKAEKQVWEGKNEFSVARSWDIQVEVSGRSFPEMKVQCSTDTSKPEGRMKAGREEGGGREEGQRRKVGRRKGDEPVPATPHCSGHYWNPHPILSTCQSFV